MKTNLKKVVVVPKPIYDEIIRELETYESNMQEIYIKSESSYFEPSIDVRCFIEKLKDLLKLEEKPCKQSQS